MSEQISEISLFRLQKDEFFAQHPQSPLTKAQKKNFRGLNYFAENPAFRFELELERFPDPQTIEIQTSTGDVQTYLREGKIHFDVDGQSAALTIYMSDNGFFLPFADSLAGTETYPAGRYLEPEPLQNGKLLIDFNLAYNPYCAYNEKWSCPLTPFENRLKVPIRAGEKIFHI